MTSTDRSPDPLAGSRRVDMKLMLNASDNRRHRRHLCSEIVDVMFEDDTGRSINEIGLIEDVSVDGLCLSFSLPLPVASEITVVASGFRGRGEVMYCEICDYGYLVGIKFASGSGWDASAWRPQHFLAIDQDSFPDG